MLQTAYWKLKVYYLEERSYNLEMENKTFANKNVEFLEPTKMLDCNL